MTASPVDDLRAAVLRAAEVLGGRPKTAPTLERPKQADHGDYATNAAMLLAGALKAPPREIAERLATALQDELGDTLVSAEVAGPGFLNLVLADSWYAAALAGGAPQPRVQTPRKVNVEFVSVNPTGPLHVGHSRNAAYGDALSRLLAYVGHDVHREYYVNDYGSQVTLLAQSIQARARGEDVPEGGYVGEYVVELAGEITGAAEMPIEELQLAGVEAMLRHNAATLDRFRVHFDTWFSEKSLHEGSPSKVEQSWADLEAAGHLYRSDGALWMRTTDFGDDKDRVLERSNGEHTYFSSDVAYHRDKRERGFELMIDVWGADHHGYIKRVKAAFAALGGDPDELDLLIMQLVSLTNEGDALKMSKRAGDFVTLDELLDMIGADAARWYLLQRSHDTHMELDVAQATKQSADNPVYYVQYAHARIAGIRKKSTATPDPALPAGAQLHPSERALIKKLLALGDELVDAAERRAVHRVPGYALELAQTFTAFYRDCPIVGDALEAFRLALAVETQRVIAQCLDLMGISAPDEM
ncbi:MAG TPA: arginine--tRNA ligase [Solirubrobacteraceae bacterium]